MRNELRIWVGWPADSNAATFRKQPIISMTKQGSGQIDLAMNKTKICGNEN
jgi:hypothetical protein